MRNILIVEDDPHDEKLTLAALEEYNLADKAFVVRDGEEALDYLYRWGKFKNRATGNPAVVLLDLKMPKINGLEVLKIIKADEDLKMIPVVVLTSSREGPDVTECYKHGTNAYVVKPMEFLEFTKAIKQLGVFWWAVNEPPPQMPREEILIQSGELVSAGKKEVNHEIPAPHPPFGG